MSSEPAPRRRELLVAIGGPAAIVGSVLIVLHGVAFGGRLPTQHPDLYAFWLPQGCFLGRSLAAGHIPLWNPYSMGGVPFAADPQSGWMYLPAMLLFATLPCAVAIRWLVVLQPVIAGLGLYAFLRGERLSRPAATLGGLMLALGLAGSRLGLFLPFPSAFAWTAVLLAVGGAYLRAERPVARMGWLLLTAFAWGQLAGAYMAHGLVLGTAALVVLVAGKAAAGASAPGAVRVVVGRALVLVLATVGVSLAVLLPRLAILGETSYGAVLSGTVQLGPRLAADWPLTFAVAPGAYLGAGALALIPLAFRRGPHRRLAVGFGVFGAAGYLLGVGPVVDPVARRIASWPGLGLLAHYPARFTLALLLALPILAAIGLDGWLTLGSTRSRLRWALPGVLVWIALPAVLGAAGWRMALPVAGVVAGGALLAQPARRARAGLFAGLVAVELTAAGLLGQWSGPLAADRAYADDLFGTARTGWFVPLAAPHSDPAAFMAEDAIAVAARSTGERYVSFDPDQIRARGYLDVQGSDAWPFLPPNRGTAVEAEDAQGYNPVQLARYWRFVRDVDGPQPLSYNAGVLARLDPVALDLLRVGAVVMPRGASPLAGWRPLATEGRWTLYADPAPPPLASVVGAWRNVRTAAASRAAVTATGFDPERDVVLERDPGIASGTSGPAGTASGRIDRGTAAITVRSGRPSIVLIRIPFAAGWRATVDERPRPVLAADSLIQAVEVPAGRHVLRLSYHEPSVGQGLVGSAISIAVILGAMVVSARRERSQGPP